MRWSTTPTQTLKVSSTTCASCHICLVNISLRCEVDMQNSTSLAVHSLARSLARTTSCVGRYAFSDRPSSKSKQFVKLMSCLFIRSNNQEAGGGPEDNSARHHQGRDGGGLRRGLPKNQGIPWQQSRQPRLWQRCPSTHCSTAIRLIHIYVYCISLLPFMIIFSAESVQAQCFNSC